MKNHAWPELDYREWKPTYETLHRWLQIVGKLRMSKSPCMNHSWHTTLYVSSRGFTTGAIPDGDRNFTVEFDFVSHELKFSTSEGQKTYLPLNSESVSSFYNRFKKCLKNLHISAYFYPFPNEVSDHVSFAMDHQHTTYNPEHAYRAWQAFVRANNILTKFRAPYVGKASPVQLFWGSFDLAVTRFSGKSAPKHPGGFPHLPLEVAQEAYSHEVSSCGFWPGNETYPEAAFYSYAYPAPEGFGYNKVNPPEAFFHSELKEFILPYKEVIRSSDPEAMVMSFLNSTFELASSLGNWNVEESEPLRSMSILQQAYSSRELQ